jgi:hypothetical protein
VGAAQGLDCSVPIIQHTGNLNLPPLATNFIMADSIFLVKDDAELTSEVVSLLGRELKVARKRTEELETRLAEQKVQMTQKIEQLENALKEEKVCHFTRLCNPASTYSGMMCRDLERESRNWKLNW